MLACSTAAVAIAVTLAAASCAPREPVTGEGSPTPSEAGSHHGSETAQHSITGAAPPAPTTIAPDRATSATEAIPPATTAPPTTDDVALVDGRSVYLAAGCDVCHGHAGQGASGDSLQESGLSLEDTIVVISFGRPGTTMRAYAAGPGKLTQAEINAVAVYVKSLQRS